MALPFQVIDWSNHERPGYAWCVRCLDWIPLKEAAGEAYDPHAMDHVQAWAMLERLHSSASRDA